MFESRQPHAGSTAAIASWPGQGWLSQPDLGQPQHLRAVRRQGIAQALSAKGLLQLAKREPLFLLAWYAFAIELKICTILVALAPPPV